MADMSATPTRRPWNITTTNQRLANNFLPDLEHFNHDNSPPVTCSGTRQAFIRRTWTVISTSYCLLCGALHTDRHAIIWWTQYFLRRLSPPRTAGRRPALVFTDLSITLASRVVAIAGTAARSSKQTWRDDYICFETLLDAEGASRAFVWLSMLPLVISTTLHAVSDRLDRSWRFRHSGGRRKAAASMMSLIFDGQALRVVGGESAAVRRPACSDGSSRHPRCWR